MPSAVRLNFSFPAGTYRTFILHSVEAKCVTLIPSHIMRTEKVYEKVCCYSHFAYALVCSVICLGPQGTPHCRRHCSVSPHRPSPPTSPAVARQHESRGCRQLGGRYQRPAPRDLRLALC